MTKEWVVITECKRNFIWSAPDRDYLERELSFRGYRATHIEEYIAPEPLYPIISEYELEVEAQERQQDFHYEHRQVIESPVRPRSA